LSPDEFEAKWKSGELEKLGISSVMDSPTEGDTKL